MYTTYYTNSSAVCKSNSDPTLLNYVRLQMPEIELLILHTSEVGELLDVGVSCY